MIPALAEVNPSAPPPTPAAPDQLGSVIGDGVASLISGPIDVAMQSLWAGCTEVLAGAFGLVDTLSKFSVSTSCDQTHVDTCGSLPHLWPILVSLSTLIALGLFFWQITVATMRGGSGMLHAASGTVGYGIALAITVTLVASLLGAADGLTDLLLHQGVHPTSSFNDVYAQLPFTQQALNGIKPMILGLVGFFGLLPAALGYAVEMMFRQATVTVLVATIPFTAAGLLTRSTARWFWISVRWTLTAVILKPAFALVLEIGLASLSNSTGLFGLLSGAAVLWVALFSPMALFRLLAFVDPATDSGGAFRDAAASFASRFATPAPVGAGAGGNSSGYAGFGSADCANRDNSGGVSDLEQANTTRFDSATPSSTRDDTPPVSDVGTPPPPPNSPPAQQPGGTTTENEPNTSSARNPDNPPGLHPGGGPCGHDYNQPSPLHPDPGNDPPEDPGDQGSGGVRPPDPHPTHPHGGPGGGGATAGEATQAAESAAVIL